MYGGCVVGAGNRSRFHINRLIEDCVVTNLINQGLKVGWFAPDIHCIFLVIPVNVPD